MKPWKSLPPGVMSGTESKLQWGHGDEAVEEEAYRGRNRENFEASMGPRR